MLEPLDTAIGGNVCEDLSPESSLDNTFEILPDIIPWPEDGSEIGWPPQGPDADDAE